MPKYIKAEALIDDFLELAKVNKGTYHEEGFKNAITVVETQDPADVVEVVRCKDCVHHHTNESKPMYVWCEMVDGLLSQNWFCADGERREDGTH